MNIHEYQAKQLLKEYGVNILNGFLLKNELEVEDKIKKNNFKTYVVKAQIHSGGRGKAGGVKLAYTKEDAIEEAKNMFGKILVTKQTGENGKKVNKVYIEEGTNIKKELYISLILDREKSKLLFVASKEGGMDIEEVSEKYPEKIVRVYIDPLIGLTEYKVHEIIYKLGIDKKCVKQMKKTLKGIYKFYLDNDASMVEINPLVISEDNDVIALDAKIAFDDNALYRNLDILDLRDSLEENEKEVLASKYDLSYISLDGNIACMVNGAGLAMATMDSINNNGGRALNFLDVGGSASKENIINAFKIILMESEVRGIFINIFGGIMKCDTIANGIIEATKELNLEIPIVIRLEGTNSKLGKNIIKNTNLNLYMADNMEDGAKKIISLVEERNI